MKVFYHITKKLQVKITRDSKKIAVTERAEVAEKGPAITKELAGPLVKIRCVARLDG